MDKPFTWGEHDCCLFVCHCVDVMTGIDPGHLYRGKYTTEKGAYKQLKKRGDGTVKTAFEQMFGVIKPRLSAQRGDIALVNTKLGDAAGIVVGGKVWVVTPDGLATVALNTMQGCWHVDDLKVSD
jgi:hypothetical protein